MAEGTAFENGRISNFEGLAWLWPWPWSGHTVYRHASLVDLYVHAKFHWNGKNVLWTDGHLRPALLSRPCRRVHLISRDHISRYFLYTLPVHSWSSSDGNVMPYVLPVLRMTSRFHIIERLGKHQRWRACFVEFARWRHHSNIRQCCLAEFARVTALRRSLPSSTASYY